VDTEGSERAVCEARWNWAAGRSEGDGQPRRRLMGLLGAVFAIAFNPRTARWILIRG